jgi:phenylpropionate dioxygenase-like ring-hydroxylating dioxygenase large terminal subunit
MTIDPFARSQWYAIGRLEDVPEGGRRLTRLLGNEIAAERTDSIVNVRLVGAGCELPVLERYGHIWTTIADEPRPLFDMPEFLEDGRRLVTAGCITVRCSGLRAVENFLDMAHFPFVHRDILGDEAHAEVPAYKAGIREETDEIWAMDCTMYQPKAAAAASGGLITRYMYRVPHPFCCVLYKTSPMRDEGVWDLIGLFIQPREQDLCDVHSFVLVFDDTNSDVQLLHFQQMIFLQDRMILENQTPALLPLDPRVELPTRADFSSITYRRWLKAKNHQYGAEPS